MHPSCDRPGWQLLAAPCLWVCCPTVPTRFSEGLWGHPVAGKGGWGCWKASWSDYPTINIRFLWQLWLQCKHHSASEVQSNFRQGKCKKHPCPPRVQAPSYFRATHGPSSSPWTALHGFPPLCKSNRLEVADGYVKCTLSLPYGT